VLAIVVVASLWNSGAVAGAAPAGATSTPVLPCASQIDASAAPSPQLTTVLGQVGLPLRDALGTVLLPNEPNPNARYWAKTGIDVRAGASFEIVVPPAWRGRLSIGWGGVRQVTRLRVAACRWMSGRSQSSPAGPWLGFAGGYWVRSPACVALVVRAGHQTRDVRLGIGAPCPGQRPPLRLAGPVSS